MELYRSNFHHQSCNSCLLKHHQNYLYVQYTPCDIHHAEIILCVCPANERQWYIVTSSLIGWAHTQKIPAMIVFCSLILNTFI